MCAGALSGAGTGAGAGAGVVGAAILGVLMLASATRSVADASSVAPANASPVRVRQDFPDRRNPPAWHALDEATQDAYRLGQLVFNSSWVPAGLANAARRDGLGPLFVLGSCDGCHNNGARGRGEVGERLPNSFVMQLGGPPTAYGAVINTQALTGYAAEAQVSLRWKTRTGRYADGAVWNLREPQYSLGSLNYGELPQDVVLRPRIGPALFGAGLLEAVPLRQLRALQRAQPRAVRGDIAWREVDGVKLPGRFGWQADAVSIEDQTARALAREMGVTSRPIRQDDCTESQWQCRDAPNGGEPEASDEFLHALVAFQQHLAVPSPAPAVGMKGHAGADERVSMKGATGAKGEALFARVGCAQCHRPVLVANRAAGGIVPIDAYTDLLVHDLGEGLADRTLAGVAVKSLWRTAPLWGMAQTIANGDPALLHDGRARSVEEAVLWHDGQAREARRGFERLPAQDRQVLLEWVESR